MFEVPGLHFWHFLKEICKRIASKLTTLVYTNRYDLLKYNDFTIIFSGILELRRRSELRAYTPPPPPKYHVELVI